MKFSFLLISAIVVLLACNKDSNDSATQNIKTPSSFQNHIWLFDSSLTTTSSYSTASYATAEEQTIVFSSDTLVMTTGNYSVTYNTSYTSPNIIYFWLPGNIEDPGTYLQANTITDAKLVISQFPSSDQTVTTYYHSK